MVSLHNQIRLFIGLQFEDSWTYRDFVEIWCRCRTDKLQRLDALHCCSYFSTPEHQSVANALLEADADINARTLRKRTALHICVLQLNVDSSAPKTAANPERMLKQSSGKWLQAERGKYDENTRSDQRLPQRKVRQSKRISESVVGMIGLLIKNGCRIDAKDCDGKTALHHAAEYGNPRTVFELVELVQTSMQHANVVLQLYV